MKDKLQSIRWGVAGPGRAGSRFAEGLRVVEGATLTAVWGRNAEKTRAYALKFGVPQVFDSLEQLVAANVDAIYVSTHPDTHAAICIHALEAGKHVLCEKPAALNERQLTEVLAAARRHDWPRSASNSTPSIQKEQHERMQPAIIHALRPPLHQQLYLRFCERRHYVLRCFQFLEVRMNATGTARPFRSAAPMQI